MKNKFCNLILISVSFFAPFFAQAKEPNLGQHLKALPVQSSGRIKPFDTFSRETLSFIYGKPHFHKKLAVDVLMSWVLVPEHWNQAEFIQIKDLSLRKALKLDHKKTLFSPQKIFQNQNFHQELKELQVREQNKTPLDKYFKSLQKLKNKVAIYQAFQRGDIPGWFPPSDNSENWLTLSQANKQDQLSFQNIIKAYVLAVGDLKKSLEKPKLAQTNLKNAVKDFQKKLSLKYPSYKKSTNTIATELFYNCLNPFRWAWVFYLLGFVFLFFKNVFRLRLFFYSFLSCFVLAFLLQGVGMLLRSLIMGRPPVTNMYETVVWVPWVSLILGAFFWFKLKAFFAFVASGAVALLCLLLADHAPTLLDGRLEPLEAVLRSNFWLSTHVLVITMSYSAFFLAFAVGDLALFFFLREKKLKPNIFQNKIRTYTKCIDRLLQTGVVLLALGVILGGIWADYSWGRFWGWDPKETWALISLLAYVALLHSRFMGWVKEFGMALGAVLIFFLIVMAWYGVNYVLGAGLHSYGFGSGGVEYVAGFFILHLVYALWAWTTHKTP